MKRILNDEKDTVELAGQLGAFLQPGDVVTLEGDLGAGKSVLCRSLINVLSDEIQEVPSPTFTLVQSYDTQKGEVWHFDLYRLEHPDEMIELGWEEALGQAIILVEWPDRLGGFMPQNRLEIRITIKETGQRQLEIVGQGAMAERMRELEPIFRNSMAFCTGSKSSSD